MLQHMLPEERRTSFTMTYSWSCEETYILLGDFNAHVGGRQSSDDQWANVHGLHGFGALNDAGKEFLSFPSVNEVTLCNT